MSKHTTTTKKELIALLTANYHELQTIFEMLPLLKKHKDAAVMREQVLASLKAILISYGVDPNEDSLYEVFKSDLDI